ncbi:MAG: hypothetical protein AB1500_08560 [Bacillota bacterium]
MIEESAGPVIFLGASAIMILNVPPERIKVFFPVGVAGGLGVALALVFLMQNALGYWVFHRVDILSVAGIPLFLSAAWLPIVIIFCHINLHLAPPVRATQIVMKTGCALTLDCSTIGLRRRHTTKHDEVSSRLLFLNLKQYINQCKDCPSSTNKWFPETVR